MNGSNRRKQLPESATGKDEPAPEGNPLTPGVRDASRGRITNSYYEY